MAGYTNRYDQIRGELKTGDILLFSNDNFIMRLWKKLTDCHWTHVGLAMQSEDTDQVLLWESTTLKNICDVRSQMAKGGVQVVLLSLRTATYNGEVAYRKLLFDPENDQVSREIVSKRLIEFRDIVKTNPFEPDLWKIIKAFIDILPFRNKESDLSKLFCSELVAAAFMHAGLLGEDPTAEEYTPKDFAEHDDILEKGVRLGTIKPIKFRSS